MVLPWSRQLETGVDYSNTDLASCNKVLTVMMVGSLVSSFALLLLIKGVSNYQKNIVKVWIYWACFELVLKVINLLMSDMDSPIIILSVIYQVVLMIVVVLLHKSLSSRRQFM